MKSYLTIAALIFTLSATAQKSKVVSAYNYLKTNELDKAKDAIDQATENPSTSDFWKTYLYRGEVYYNITMTQNEAFKALSENPLKEAFNAYTKLYSYESSKLDMKDVDRRYKELIPPAFNKGVTAFNEGNYDNAIDYFNISKEVYSKFNIVDSLSIYNIALSADRKGDVEQASKYYRECLAINYKPEIIYADLANVYLRAENEEEALKILQEGNAKFPGNQTLLTMELNIYLKNNQFDKALVNLNEAIKSDPNNYIFYYARGTIYNNNKDFEKAEPDYLKAIEIKPDHFDSYYNLGAMYFNDAVELNNAANEIPANKNDEYQKKKSEAIEVFEKALPFLEKAHELDEKDLNTMNSLKQLYAITKRNDKYTEMNEKLNAQ